jgi:tetratricopeptide (TPR) repeat protein
MQQLRGLWARAVEGHVLVAVVAGEAGIGKTRLVAEFAAEVTGGGNRVLLGSCFEDRRVPYDPFVQAISADVGTLSPREARLRAGSAARLGWLVPELGAAGSATGPDSSLDPASIETEMAKAVHGYLVRAAHAQPLVLVVEDVHWATSTTLGALRHLARMSGNAPLLVVVTVRVGLPAMEADLAPFLLELGRLPAVEQVLLAGLSEPEVDALIHTLGGHGEAAAVRAQTGGNPLLVREALGAPGGLKGSLETLLGAHYSLLGRDDLAVLDMAAVVGAEFDADLVAAAGGRHLSAVIEALERAESAGLVARQPGRPGRFSFVHSLIRDARYGAIPTGRRVTLHREVATALEEVSDHRSLPDLARHVALGASLDEARDDEHSGESSELVDRARRSLRQSGDRAMALNDLAAARRAYEAALELWPRDDADRPSLQLALGRTLVTAESRGADVLSEARDGLLALGNDEGAAQAEMLLGELRWIGSRWDEAEAHFERAATLVANRQPSRATAEVTAGLARFRMIAGANREARRDGSRALEMARALGLTALEANVLHTLGPARVNEGDLGGIDDLEAGIRLAEALDSPEARRGYANLTYVYAILGDTRRCREWRGRARDAAERFGVTEGVRWAQAHDIGDRFALGHWDEALQRAEAFIATTEASAHYLVTAGLWVRASIRLGRGNQIGALADAAAAVEFARGARHPANLLVALPFQTRCLFEAGRSDDAAVAITETLAAAAGNENILEPIELAIAMWGLGRRREYLDAAARTTIPSRRWEVGRAIVHDDLVRAADILNGMEHRSAEAYVRLLAAEQHAAAGRRGDAAEQIHGALAFHRSVRATAYVARGEALVAP